MAEQASSATSSVKIGAMTRRQWVGFFVLCLLAASGWLVEEAWPSLRPAASREYLHYLVIAFVAGIFGWRRIARSSFRSTPVTRLAIAGVCLSGIPAALIEPTRGGVSEATITALFSMLPVAVVLLMPHFSISKRVDSATTSLLAPALIGLAGTLLLLPFALPASLREARLFAVILFAVLIAATASVCMYRLLVKAGMVEAVVIYSFANAMFLLAVSLVSNAIGGSSRGVEWSWNAVGVEALKAVCLDMPQVVLLLWLMREVAPERLAARTLVIPLVTVLEGYALLRPEMNLRSIGGAALLFYGAWRLLTGRHDDEEPGLMLR